MTLSSTVYPCASKKYLVHTTIGSASSTPTSSASVELLVLIFCFADMKYMLPLPMVKTAPCWIILTSVLTEIDSHYFFTVTHTINSSVIVVVVYNIQSLKVIRLYLLIHIRFPISPSRSIFVPRLWISLTYTTHSACLSSLLVAVIVLAQMPSSSIPGICV